MEGANRIIWTHIYATDKICTELHNQPINLSRGGHFKTQLSKIKSCCLQVLDAKLQQTLERLSNLSCGDEIENFSSIPRHLKLVICHSTLAIQPTRMKPSEPGMKDHRLSIKVAILRSLRSS